MIEVIRIRGYDIFYNSSLERFDALSIDGSGGRKGPSWLPKFPKWLQKKLNKLNENAAQLVQTKNLY